jgi:hypothetical protein
MPEIADAARWIESIAADLDLPVSLHRSQFQWVRKAQGG